MKFLRILPETCASTWCLFSSSTLNMALGNGSTTVAITSIASSLLMHSYFRPDPSLRSGFRQRAPAALTPARRLNFNRVFFAHTLLAVSYQLLAIGFIVLLKTEN